MSRRKQNVPSKVFSHLDRITVCVWWLFTCTPPWVLAPPPSPLKTVRCSFCKRWDWFPDRLSGSFALVAISWQYPYMRRGWIEVLSSGHSSNRVAWWPWKSNVNAHGAAKMKFNSRWWKTVPTSAVKLFGLSFSSREFLSLALRLCLKSALGQ